MGRLSLFLLISLLKVQNANGLVHAKFADVAIVAEEEESVVTIKLNLGGTTIAGSVAEVADSDSEVLEDWCDLGCDALQECLDNAQETCNELCGNSFENDGNREVFGECTTHFKDANYYKEANDQFLNCDDSTSYQLNCYNDTETTTTASPVARRKRFAPHGRGPRFAAGTRGLDWHDMSLAMAGAQGGPRNRRNFPMGPPGGGPGGPPGGPPGGFGGPPPGGPGGPPPGGPPGGPGPGQNHPSGRPPPPDMPPPNSGYRPNQPPPPRDCWDRCFRVHEHPCFKGCNRPDKEQRDELAVCETAYETVDDALDECYENYNQFQAQPSKYAPDIPQYEARKPPPPRPGHGGPGPMF